MARRTAGTAIGPDMPLMEAGIDSLGAVELRNQLQAVSHSDGALPSTVVFDHPTARQLVAALSLATQCEVPEKQVKLSQSSWPLVSIGGVVTRLPAELTRAAFACAANAISEVPASRWLVSNDAAVRHVRFVAHVQNAELFVIPSGV